MFFYKAAKLTLEYKRENFRDRYREGVFFLFSVISLLVAGCGQESDTSGPVEGPEVVVERFYGYISEAKIKGGGTPAREAFKLINAEGSQYRIEQFLQVVQKYPPGFKADVGEARIDGVSALVTISYMMPSMFDEGYEMVTNIPLTIDAATNTWKIDFTGETYGMDREAAGGSQVEFAQENISINEVVE